MSNLNPAQQEAVETIDWPLLINAWAWSGKTHTVTERVVSMITERQIDPRSIFCVTFTNKAAREMRDRIARRLGVTPKEISPFRTPGLPTIGTFHSIAAFFLRMFIDRLGYGKDFIIYDSDDCLRTVKDIMKSQNIDDKEFNPRSVLSMISKAKGEWLTPVEYSMTVDSYFGSIVLEVYKAYVGKMRKDNALDFDDLLLLFRQVLDDEEVREYFHGRYQYFMVDEYQDTNTLQYETIRILASKTRNLCVVGDDWQGIYSWRGANIENILSFKKDYPEAKVINLEENYRSTKVIIEAANSVIKNNVNQMKKTLFTSNPTGEKIKLLEGLDEKHEAELIASKIRESIGESRHREEWSDPVSETWIATSSSTETGWSSRVKETKPSSYSSFAILYRTNGQSRLLEESLIRKNIPYRVYGGVKFYERKEIKDVLAYIRIIFNPLDSASLKRIINVPSRKIGEKSLEAFLEIMEREHMDISQIAEEPMIVESMSGIGANGIKSFVMLYKMLRDISRTESVATLMESIIKRTNYEAYLKDEYGEDEYEWKLENLEEFVNMASRYDGMSYPENLASFLEDIALITDQDRNNETQNDRWQMTDDSGHVSLMTIHLAKGLEFPTVFIAGAEDGIFPHSRTLMDAREIEEERRLMYVAITRAKTMLYISRAHERYTFGNYSANPKSRFVKEISSEHIEIEESRWSGQSIFGSGSGGFSTLSNMFQWSNAYTAKPANQLTSKPAKNSASDFSLWDRLEHAQYGVGTIVAISGAIADIAFSGTGIKKMNVEIAPVKKI
jgi:DNA helicase II / ATP-dependent DNA helicase PcrA